MRSKGQRRPRAARAEAGRERVAGRRVRAGGSAAARRPDSAPRLGASSCLAAAAAASSSSQAARAGRLLGLGQHFPAVSHTALRERGAFTHTHTPPDRALPQKNFFKNWNRSEKGWRTQKPDRGAQTWESPRSGGRGRGGQTPAARGQLSLSGEAPQSALRAGRTGIPGADSAAWGGRQRPPLFTFRVSGPRLSSGHLPHARLKARARARGGREVHGRATARTATEGRYPPTIPRNSPVSSRFLSSTSACVCV